MVDKNQILDEAMKNIEKQFGKGIIMKMWDWTISQVNTFHSWSYMLDSVLWWWYPEWRIIEIYWPESSGKTTFTLHAIAEVQKSWNIAAFIDAEHALDPVYAENLWVDVKNLLLSQPDYWEQALQIAEELAKSWAVKLIVIDSVSAMTPRTEVEWDMWDSYMWLQARMMSQWLRKLAWILSKTWTSVIFINQIRMKIWIMFWNPETTSWWNALKFFASQRLDIRRWEKIEKDKEQIWYIAKIKVIKNKIAPPFKKAEIMVNFNKWINEINDIIEVWLDLWLIKRAWAFYSIWDKKTQWKEKLVTLLTEDINMKNEIKNSIVEKLSNLRSKKESKDLTDK